MKIRFIKTRGEYSLQYKFLFIWFNFEEFVYSKYLSKDGETFNWEGNWEICTRYNKDSLYDLFFLNNKKSLFDNLMLTLLNKSKIIIENEISL